MSDTPCIRVRGLYKNFSLCGNVVQVLRGVDLDVACGEQIGIVGASGAGKTTLLHILGGLEPPTSGSVELFGKDLTSKGEAETAKMRNRDIGFVFQFHQLLPEFSAAENTAMPLLIGGVPKREAMERAAHMLEKVGLADRVNHRPAELSGGEQQRVAIARAMIREPKLLLVDEPTGSLDSVTGGMVADILFFLASEHKVTLVVVTHNEKLASRLPRVEMLKDGAFVRKGDAV